MIKRLFLIIIFMLFSLPTLAANYYVSQSGSGSKNGTLGNDWDVGQFNALTGTAYAGHTINFSGTFSTRVLVKISGTSGNQVILDGWSGGDCSPITAACSSSAVLEGGMGVGADGNNNVDYVTIQDFRMTTSVGNGNKATLSVWGGDSVSLDYISIKRNYIYNSNHSNFFCRYVDHFEMNGNKTFNCAQGTFLQTGCVILDQMDYVLIANNEFGHDEDSYPSDCSSCNEIEIHSTDYMLFEYNNVYGGPNQAGVADKENNNQTYHIYRFNKFHDNALKPGLNIGGGSYTLSNYYIYGNYMYNNVEGGGSSYDTGLYHYWWANIFSNNDWGGFLTWDRELGYPNYVYLYNNTFAYNGDVGTGPNENNRGGITNQAAYNLTAKNNIFYMNRPSENGLYNQVYDARSGVYEHNTLYNSVGTPTWYYDGGQRTLATMQGTYNLEDDNPDGRVGDPGMTDPSNGDYTLDGSVVDDGADDLNQCFNNIPINAGEYTTISVCTSWGLDPNNTDWTATPHTAAVLDRQVYGWDRGAYVYATGSNPGDTTPPTLLSAAINSSGTTITLNFSEIVTEGGTGSDWALTLSGGAVTFSNPSVALDVTYDLSRTVIEGETVSVGLNYTQPGNGIEDGAGNDMVSITSFSVTNNSIVPNPTTYTGVGITVQ